MTPHAKKNTLRNKKINKYIPLWNIQGAYNKFPDFFHMGI